MHRAGAVIMLCVVQRLRRRATTTSCCSQLAAMDALLLIAHGVPPVAFIFHSLAICSSETNFYARVEKCGVKHTFIIHSSLHYYY